MGTPLSGTWSLTEWANETPDGVRTHPFGQAATGFISYSPDGFVFVHLTAETRDAFSTSDPFGATPEEYVAAMKTHLTYAGNYKQDGNVVRHFVSHSSIPNWVGTTQVRSVTFNGEDTLTLAADAILLDGQLTTATLNWSRAASDLITS